MKSLCKIVIGLLTWRKERLFLDKTESLRNCLNIVVTGKEVKRSRYSGYIYGLCILQWLVMIQFYCWMILCPLSRNLSPFWLCFCFSWQTIIHWHAAYLSFFARTPFALCNLCWTCRLILEFSSFFFGCSWLPAWLRILLRYINYATLSFVIQKNWI